MHAFYLPVNSYARFVELYPHVPWRKLDIDTAVLANQFLQENCQFNLVFMQPEFKGYAPILVICADDSGMLTTAEVLYNMETNLAEVYNVCTHHLHRNRGYASRLGVAFDELQQTLKCDMWIAVASNNPLHSVAVEMYIKMGFTGGIRTSYITPSGISSLEGFTRMIKPYSSITR